MQAICSVAVPRVIGGLPAHSMVAITHSHTGYPWPMDAHHTTSHEGETRFRDLTGILHQMAVGQKTLCVTVAIGMKTRETTIAHQAHEPSETFHLSHTDAQRSLRSKAIGGINRDEGLKWPTLFLSNTQLETNLVVSEGVDIEFFEHIPYETMAKSRLDINDIATDLLQGSTIGDAPVQRHEESHEIGIDTKVIFHDDAFVEWISLDNASNLLG